MSRLVCVLVCLAHLCAIAMAGCSTTVAYPAHPRDPVTVLLLDHGRTPSLVLPTDDGKAVRYAYGDWKWYAQRKTDALTGVAALCWPTRGALGRKILPHMPDAATINAVVSVGVEHVYSLDVPGENVRKLLAQLDQQFSDNLASRIVNEPYDLEFVHAPRRYWLLHNSNQVAAQWLRELDCQVRGPALTSTWIVRPAAE